jgi:hypothetical protein
VRLKAMVVDGCLAMTGVLRVGGAPRKRFTAVLSRCGDGMIDPGNYEECDGGVCDDGQACTVECTCPPPVLPPASTTTTRPPPATVTTTSTTSTVSTGPPGTSVTTTTTLTPTSTTVDERCPDRDDTFQEIQQHVFAARGCTVATCHGPFASGGMDLRPGAAYPELVDVPATNAAARAAGKKRVVPFDAGASFLSQKLHATLRPGEGSPMPAVGRRLSATELALVDAWIDGGAPAVGVVAGAPCPPEEEYVPADPLPPPPGGYQILLQGPTLQPGQEEEGCLWIRAPNAANFDVGSWEFSLNPGTHHFAVFEYNRAGSPATGIWRRNDFGCFSGTEFGNNVSGSPQSPYFVDAYPRGVARTLRAGSYLGLNAHYYNEFDVPIEVKVWINIHPYPGTPAHRALTIVDIDDTFAIRVPPFTVQTFPPLGQPRARWTNTTSRPRTVISLSGHMHHRGLRFTAWRSDGTKLYENFDWAHPIIRYLDPPLVLAPGDFVEYECLYDNGVDRPVRRNASGRPVDLVFGVSAEDAMCIVTGQYYQD